MVFILNTLLQILVNLPPLVSCFVLSQCVVKDRTREKVFLVCLFFFFFFHFLIFFFYCIVKKKIHLILRQHMYCRLSILNPAGNCNRTGGGYICQSPDKYLTPSCNTHTHTEGGLSVRHCSYSADLPGRLPSCSPVL